MKKTFLFLTVVIVALFGSVASVSACSSADEKNDIYFNIGVKFFKVNLTKENPRADVNVDGVVNTLELVSTGETKFVKLHFLNNTRSYNGKLAGIYRCGNTPSRVIWDDWLHNAESLGGVQLREHFRFYYEGGEVGSKLVRPYNSTAYGFVDNEALPQFNANCKMASGAILVGDNNKVLINKGSFFEIRYREFKNDAGEIESRALYFHIYEASDTERFVKYNLQTKELKEN